MDMCETRFCMSLRHHSNSDTKSEKRDRQRKDKDKMEGRKEGTVKAIDG